MGKHTVSTPDYSKITEFIIKQIKVEKLGQTGIRQCLACIEQALKKELPLRKKNTFLSVKAALDERLAEIENARIKDKGK